MRNFEEMSIICQQRTQAIGGTNCNVQPFTGRLSEQTIAPNKIYIVALTAFIPQTGITPIAPATITALPGVPSVGSISLGADVNVIANNEPVSGVYFWGELEFQWWILNGADAFVNGYIWTWS